MEKLVSEGNCVFCGETYKQSGMSRHLATHLSKMTPGNQCSFHLNISAGEMFLHVLMDDRCKKRWRLESLSGFLGK